jgi:dipeptide/tripeptide permease
MDSKNLAKTLLRVLSVWLFAQSIPQLLAGILILSQSQHPSLSVSTWAYPFMGLATLCISVVVYCLSDRLSQMIAERA